ncbi:hemolysin family protein [Rhodococcus aerolatus]
MSAGPAVVVALLLLAGNAFFVGAEFALVSARRSQVEPRALEGSRAARTTLKAMEHVSLVMAGSQLGITLCSLGLGAVGEPAVAALVEVPLHALGLPDGLLHPVSLAIALLVVVYLHMVLGEMVPKNLAIAGPERAALVLGPPMYAVVRALKPLIVALNASANAVLWVLRVEPQDEVASSFTAEEVVGLVEESGREGAIDAEDQQLITAAVQLEEATAEQVLMPLADLVTVAPGATVRELEELCASTGFSRFPVRDEDGGLSTYVHVKDLLGTPAERRDDALDPDRVRRLADVAPADSLREVLGRLQHRGAHLARVRRGDTGELVGLVALEDVVEELVGEVAGLAGSREAG